MSLSRSASMGQIQTFVSALFFGKSAVNIFLQGAQKKA